MSSFAPWRRTNCWSSDSSSAVPYAAETGASVNTLLSRKRYAVLHLRKRLQRIYDELTKT
jgi:hypothetical protein